MGGFWNKLGDISSVLEDVSAAADTANHGIRKTQESGEHLSRVAKRIVSGDNEKARNKVIECEKMKSIYIRRTFVFCIVLILATVLFCTFFEI